MKKTCVRSAEILLPKTEDLYAWAVIACDQHTSDFRYWEELEKLVGDKPSTLRLTLPEIFLDEGDSKIAEIVATMREYSEQGVFYKTKPGYVLVERDTPYSPTRFGIVLAVDLEEYSYEIGAKAQIKATEATILERIPPRLRIRRGATIEFPHVMLLYNDAKDVVLKTWKDKRDSLSKLYDTDLNMGGGHIRGYFIPENAEIENAFASIADKDGVIFMVGDGNHSLATAKAAWDEIKAGLSESERQTHPARYALCEAVNVYDSGISFEAIHRIVKGVDPKLFMEGFTQKDRGEAYLVCNGEKYKFSLGEDVASAVEYTDAYISSFIAEHGGSADYIHGEDEIIRITKEMQDSVGILLPKMKKEDLFETVKRHGCLPRKTFSMGESAEKRYYIEGKEIAVK